jgi:two-component system OmpR family sensor kinase
MSYILLIVLTLSVIGVALLLLLQTRPLLTESTSMQLYALLQQIDVTLDDQNITIPATGPTFRQRNVLNRLDRRLNRRILLINNNGLVTYDSRRFYKYGDTLTLDARPYIPPTDEPEAATHPAVNGVLHNPDGSDWLFMAQAADPTVPQRFVVAIHAPASLSPIETLQYYGPDFVVPLVEAGAIGVIVAILMSLIITRSVAQPLQQVARAASAVAQGRHDQRVPERGPLEVRTLAQAFNQMAEQVGAAGQAQRDFLANVTHDLRTPLTSIQGFSQAIIDGVASNPAAAQRAAQIIHDEAGRLNRMVQELLDLARIEAGRLNMTQHSVGLSEILNALGERLAPRAVEKGVTLSLDIPSLPQVAGDGDRLVQVYTNLIENAIKHTQTGGSITVQAAPADNGILVEVSDTGEGIPAADLPHIFDRFYQVDKSRQRKQRDGVGLGLAITKGIVDAHGGRLWVESQEGTGTTFFTWFPALASDSTTLISRRSGIFKSPTGSKSPADRQKTNAR